MRLNLHSNAPPAWPLISVERWDSERSAPNIEPVAQALDAAFVAARAPRPILLYVVRLFPGGFLPVPIEVVEPTGHVPVLVYPNGRAESSGHYRASAALLAGRQLSAVYVSSEPLTTDAAAVDPLRPFAPDFLGIGDSTPPQGRFGMWWPDETSPRFSASAAFGCFERLYRAIDGIESYVFGAILSSLGMIRGGPQRVALPADMAPVHITGPDLRPMFFSATSEKGIRFRFALDTPPWYRDAFWRFFCEYVEQLRRSAEQNLWALDPPASRHTLGWWEFFKRSLPAVEVGHEGFVFGPLITVESDRRG